MIDGHSPTTKPRNVSATITRIRNCRTPALGHAPHIRSRIRSPIRFPIRTPNSRLHNINYRASSVAQVSRQTPTQNTSKEHRASSIEYLASGDPRAHMTIQFPPRASWLHFATHPRPRTHQDMLL